MNAYAERFLQTLQDEGLDHFMIFGQKHLNYLVQEFLDYYHHKRPHQGKGNKLLVPTDSSEEAVIKAKDLQGMRELDMSEKLDSVPSGTPVWVIQEREDSNVSEVRILHGPLTGKLVWVKSHLIEEPPKPAD